MYYWYSYTENAQCQNSRAYALLKGTAPSVQRKNTKFQTNHEEKLVLNSETYHLREDTWEKTYSKITELIAERDPHMVWTKVSRRFSCNCFKDYIN